MKSQIRLYHSPGACSQVCLCALEEAGLDYQLALTDTRRGDQFKPEFLKISPLNKVPAVVIDGAPLTENAAILTFISSMAPDCGILPGFAAAPRLQADAQAGLSFCGGTLHPQLRGVVAPQRLTTGDEIEPIRQRSWELVRASFEFADRLLANRGWWLGTWSIVDVYLNWAFSVARRDATFDAGGYPNLDGLTSRLANEKASFRRMLEIDRSLNNAGIA